MTCNKKHILLLVLILTGLFACNEGVEIPVPENKQTVYKITPSGQDIEYRDIRLEIPQGAVTSEQEITFLTRNICDTSYGDIYFFLCEAFSLSPNNLVFSKPVRMSVSLDLNWIKVIDEEGYGVNLDKDKMVIYKIDTVNHTCTPLEDCELSYTMDKVTVASDINTFGVYQVGLDEKYIDYRKGFMKVRFENFAGKDSFQFNSNIIRHGYANLAPLYLRNSFILRIILTDKDNQGLANLESQISGIGYYETIMSVNRNVSFLARYMPYEEYGYMIWTFNIDDTAKINITRFDEMGGRVEGTWESMAYKIPNNPAELSYTCTIKVDFSVPKY